MKRRATQHRRISVGRKKNIISSDKFVKITTDQEVIYGEGLEADERMTRYKILKPQGTIKVKMNDAENDENI